jgi:K+-sensing histidine kinase KdpD
VTTPAKASEEFIGAAEASRSPAVPKVPRTAREFVFALCIVGTSTLVALALRPYVAPTNLAMIFLLGVVVIAIRCKRHPSVLASFLSVAAFDYFCVPPYLTLRVSDYEYVLTFVGMLVVTLVISTQTARIQKQAEGSAISRQKAEAARIQVETEQMRNALLSAISHDIRTPLASITGAASTLQSQGEKLQPGTRQELLESIAEEAERLNRLVTNLLDMTRFESGIELRKDLYPLEEIVGSALQRMGRQLDQRQVTTYLPESLPLVSADDVLLGQVIVNLLENATKYTPEGTPIEVAAEPSDGAITLEIRDRGPGFAPGDERRIFEKFYRGRAEGRGVGLGLAICKAIIEAHRGTIEALSRTGGGAIFRIRLPLEG